MKNSELLDLFIFRDKFNLDIHKICAESQVAAKRRAEIMRWSNVYTILKKENIYIENLYTCYLFEIWGNCNE